LIGFFGPASNGGHNCGGVDEGLTPATDPQRLTAIFGMIGSTVMKRIDLYIKVEVEMGEEETPEKLAKEICRQIEKIYVVRKAELSNAVARD